MVVLTKEQQHDAANNGPLLERDNCGVGFVCSIKGVTSSKIMSDARMMLERMAHRGACGCDNDSGDGAGVLTANPDALYRKSGKLPIVPSTSELQNGLMAYYNRKAMSNAHGMWLFPHSLMLNRRNTKYISIFNDLADAKEGKTGYDADGEWETILPAISLDFIVNGKPYVSEDDIAVGIGQEVDIEVVVISSLPDVFNGLLALECEQEISHQLGSINTTQFMLVMGAKKVPFAVEKENKQFAKFKVTFIVEGSFRVRPQITPSPGQNALLPEDMFATPVAFSISTKI